MSSPTRAPFFVVALLVILHVLGGCALFQGNTQGDLLEIKGNEGSVFVRDPGKDVLGSGASAQLKAVAEKGKELLSANVNIGLTFERIQKENPDLHVQDVLQYHLATVYATGGITKAEYGELSRELFRSTLKKQEHGTSIATDSPTSGNAVRPASARCWEGDRWKESRENIDWVMWKDEGALGRYRGARSSGKSIYTSLMAAQSRNDNARRTIEALGSECVEEYVRTVYADRQ